jgi:hypothetical protein
MLKGIIHVSIYYCIGLLVAWGVYSMEETHYAHGPGPRELIVFLTLIGGAMWFMVAIARYISNRTEKLKGVVMTHFFVFVAVTIFIIIILNPSDEDDSSESVIPEIIIEEAGDTTTIRHKGNPIYYKIKDSVQFNFIDSSRIDWSKAERRRR